MKNKDVKIVKSVLGEDFFEKLEKYEIYKPETKTVVDPEEIKVALQIVPRMVLSYLFANLQWREAGDVCKLELPFAPGAVLNINKKGNDNYHGDVVKEGKKIVEFQHRSLPSIGLVLLTSLELYDMVMLEEIKQPEKEKKDLDSYSKVDKLQDLIDERFMTHRLIQDVVDKRISEREAINKLIKERLHSHIMMVNAQKEEDPMEEKKSKLKQFLENREQRRQESVEMDKSEVKCSDCGTTLYKSENKDKVKLCVCYGEHMNKEIKFKKSEDGTVQFKFPKWFDIENIEMFLDNLKKK